MASHIHTFGLMGAMYGFGLLVYLSIVAHPGLAVFTIASLIIGLSFSDK